MADYKTDIDLTFSGTENVDYAIERPWADAKVLDRKTVVLKSSATITFTHNARNYLWIDDGNGGVTTSVLGVTDPSAVMRYRVDRDLQWSYHFAGNGGSNLNPAYSAPFTFDSLTYDGSTPVVGTTGDIGGPLTAANKDTYYWRGIVSPFNEEYHILTVGDDDTANGSRCPNYEFWASGAQVHLFNVNPPHPALVIAGTGDAQWYTTPCKAYFQPRIARETTYFNAGTGSLSFTILDINGNNVSYRINGGSWVNAGASSVALSPSDFPLTGAATPNTLDYYYAGSGSTSNYKTRPMVKNPGFPSAGETHGTLFLGTGDTWTKRVAQISRSSTWAHVWADVWETQSTTNRRTNIQSAWGLGDRTTSQKGSMEAVMAMVYGWNNVPSQSGVTWSRGRFVRTMAVDNYNSIDPVGLEKNQAGVNGTVTNSLGSREIIYRGYYDMNSFADLLLLYDIGIAYFRNDQGYSDGFTAIEDYKIRDDIAMGIQTHAIFNGQFADYGPSVPGMWDTARNCYALAACYVIPTYSSECFGTCGLDGNTTTYPYNPFPNQQYTWKQILITEDYTLGSFPNMWKGFGLENSPAGLFATDGTYRDKQVYLNMANMGHAIAFAMNASQINNPSRAFPCTMQGLLRVLNGTIRGLVNPEDGVGQYNLVTTFNSRFSAFAASGYAWAVSQPDTSDQRMGLNMTRSFAFGLLWIDEPLNVQPGNPRPSLALFAGSP